MTQDVTRASAFLDGLKRATNWVASWDSEVLLILQHGNLWGYALPGLAESCLAGGAALAQPQSGFRTAASAARSSLLLSEERAARERRQHIPRPGTMQPGNVADIISNIRGRELPGNEIFNAWKTPFKPEQDGVIEEVASAIRTKTGWPCRTVQSLPNAAKRLDRSALIRLAGGIYEPESPPRRGAVGRMLRRNIRSTPLPHHDLAMHKSWLAGLSRRAIGALGRIKPELLVLRDPSASAKPQRSKKGLFEDRFSPSLESERAPIDLLACLSEKHGPASIDGRGGFRPEIACQLPVSANKTSPQEAGIFPASRLPPGEESAFSASPGVAPELGMLNKSDDNETEYGNAQSEKTGDIPESKQPTAFFRAVNDGDGNWPLAAASRDSLPEVGTKPASRLSAGEVSAFSAASRKALELGMLNKSDDNETAGGIPENLQPSAFSRAAKTGNWPDADTSASPASSQKGGLLPASRLPSGEASAFSAASRKALELGMLNKSDDNETEYGNAQNETVGDIHESSQPTAFFRAVNDGDGNWPPAACKTSRLVFGMPLMPNLLREEADAASSIALSTGGAPAKALLSLQNRRETASDEDLDALAARIKRILEEEARRHGIDV